MMTKSHPDSDRPWPGMFNNSEAGCAWKENLTIILLSPSPSITLLTENIWSVEKKKNGEGKGEEYLETENIWSAEKRKEKGEGKEQSKSHHHQTKMTWFLSLAPEVVARARRLRVEREPPGCQKPTEPMRYYWTKWIWGLVILNCHSCDDHLHHGQLFVCLPFPIVVLLKSGKQEKTGWHSCKASRMMMMLLQRWRWRLMVTADGDGFLFSLIFVFLPCWSWWRWGKPGGQHEHPRRVKVRKRQEN